MTTAGCYNGGDGKHSGGHPAVCQLDTTSGGTLNYNAGEVEAALWLAPFNFYGSNNFSIMYPNIQQCGKEASVDDISVAEPPALLREGAWVGSAAPLHEPARGWLLCVTHPYPSSRLC